MIADAPAAQLIATVIVKSTSKAPRGMNAQPSPYAEATLRAPPPPSGNRRMSWW
jgi:hypothetical protein